MAAVLIRGHPLLETLKWRALFQVALLPLNPTKQPTFRFCPFGQLMHFSSCINCKQQTI